MGRESGLTQGHGTAENLRLCVSMYTLGISSTVLCTWLSVCELVRVSSTSMAIICMWKRKSFSITWCEKIALVTNRKGNKTVWLFVWYMTKGVLNILVFTKGGMRVQLAMKSLTVGTVWWPGANKTLTRTSWLVSHCPSWTTAQQKVSGVTISHPVIGLSSLPLYSGTGPLFSLLCFLSSYAGHHLRYPATREMDMVTVSYYNAKVNLFLLSWKQQFSWTENDECILCCLSQISK